MHAEIQEEDMRTDLRPIEDGYEEYMGYKKKIS